MNKAILALGAVLALVLTTSALGDDFSQGNGANAAPNWKLLGKNASGHEGTSSPAQAFADGIGFAFSTDPVDSKLFVTEHPGDLLGNLTGKTLTASFTITGAATAFTYWGEGQSWNTCRKPKPTPASVHLYFAGNPTGQYVSTDEWWSNAGAPVVTGLNGNTVTLTVPLDTAHWTDHNLDPPSDVSAGFAAAVATVSSVGVSFGGGCGLYALTGGVAPTNGNASFVLQSYSVS
jgi:hypothetical protein